MCGIAGCLALAFEADPDQAWLTRALDRISHRGPDDDGVYTDPDVALGFRRLSILDLSLAGHQPMRSADGRYWILFNGEIYNYVELGDERREQGITLRSTGDAEVLLETYARVGKDVVHRLRGMYAFAIWDTWTRELFCARDPFGIKPFYYCIDRGLGPVPAGQAGVPAVLARGAAPEDSAAPDAAAAPEDAAVPDAAAAPEDAAAPARPRGGRHAAAEAAGDPYGREQASSNGGGHDWFTPAARPARRPGRHAAGGPDGPGVLHDKDAAGGPSAAAAPARTTVEAPRTVDLRLRLSSQRKALGGPGGAGGRGGGRSAGVPPLRVVPGAGPTAPADPGAAAGARDDRPARAPGRRLPLLAGRPAAGPRRQRVHAGRDPRRDARLRRGPPAQPRPARGLPVRRHRLRGDLRARRGTPAGPADVHRGVRARGLQRDRPGAGDGGG